MDELGREMQDKEILEEEDEYIGEEEYGYQGDESVPIDGEEMIGEEEGEEGGEEMDKVIDEGYEEGKSAILTGIRRGNGDEWDDWHGPKISLSRPTPDDARGEDGAEP